jgi:hypothetical protein
MKSPVFMDSHRIDYVILEVYYCVHEGTSADVKKM